MIPLGLRALVEGAATPCVLVDREGRVVATSGCTSDRLGQAAPLGTANLVDASGYRVVTLGESATASRVSCLDAVVFEHSPLAMWIQRPDRRLVAVNDAACRRYGWTREQMLELSALDLRPPAERGALRAAPTVGPEVPIHRPGLTRHQARDGRTFWVDVVSHAVSFGGQAARLVIALDVDAQVEAEQELQRAHARLHAIVEAAPIAIYSVDLDGRVSTWNAIAGHMFGFRSDRTPIEQAGVFDEAIRRVHGGESLLGVPLERRDDHGRPLALQLFAAPILERNGRPRGAACIALDVTAQRALEAQLSAAQRLESLGLLAGGVAHDFNNLLTVILAATTELADAGACSEELADIQSSAERAAGLVRQLLLFGRASPDKPRDVDLEMVIADLVPMLRRIVREDVHLSLRLTGEALLVHADPGQLEQLVSNLVVNAGDAIGHGGRVSIGLGRALLRGERPAISLVVEDDGPGIRPSVLPHVFEPFFTTKPRGRGTGLGLATVRSIVERWGGVATVTNAAPHGARFEILLPAIGAAAEQAPSSQARVRATAVEGRHVLVVDDDTSVCRIAERILTRAGCKVVVAHSVGSAIAAAEAGAVDLVLLDYVLPDGEGPEVARAVRRLHPGVRILYSTGHLPDDAAEVSPLLPKPYDAESLRSHVAALLAG
ncbi:MAG: PAS domain S-box protein [Myxococcales bacterium]|nr:PAS domain S-box protein [Myxococcales bacterium]